MEKIYEIPRATAARARCATFVLVKYTVDLTSRYVYTAVSDSLINSLEIDSLNILPVYDGFFKTISIIANSSSTAQNY